MESTQEVQHSMKYKIEILEEEREKGNEIRPP